MLDSVNHECKIRWMKSDTNAYVRKFGHFHPRKFLSWLRPCLGLMVVCGLSRAAEPLRIGVAETEITPPNGYPMSGYYHERLATGTIDPLKAHAIVFRQGAEQAAIVTCDLTGIAHDLSTEVRRQVSAKTGIPVQNLVVTATHSHTAPDYFKDLFQHLGKTGSLSERGRYVTNLIDRIVDAAVQAHAKVQPAILTTASGRQDVPVSFNRRFVMRDGSVRTWMNLANPEVVRPAGPIDPEIGIVVARAVEGNQPLAVLSNFALHLDTVGGNLWSADYPFFIERDVRAHLGPHVISLFGAGCCGDINHSDPSRKDRNKTDMIGGELGKTIRTALEHTSAINEPTLRVRSTVVRAPLQDVTEEQLAQAKELLTTVQSGKTVDFFKQVEAYRQMMVDQLRQRRSPAESSRWIGWGLSHTWGGIGKELSLEVTTFTFGSELAIVFLPGEVFVDLGLAIKRGSPFRTTLVIELANCVETVYIPTRAAFAGGSYEVTNSACLPGTGEALVEAALRLLRDAATTAVAKP